jgi:hypothetical protein
MAKIRINVDGILMDGHELSFKAPCDCTEIDGIKVYFIENGVQRNKVFEMKDTHGNTLTGLGNLFEAGACVKVILDTVYNVAYIVNGDTNGYLEGKLREALYLVSFDSATGTLVTRSADYTG